MKDTDKIQQDNEIVNKNENKNPMSKKKIIGLIFVVLVITAVMVVVLININDFSNTLNLIKNISPKYLWFAIGCLIIYYITYPLSLMIVAKDKKCKIPVGYSFLIGGSEHFFNAITPFASGGQPIQIYLYTQKGMSASRATGIVMANFIAFMISTNMYAIASLFFINRFATNFNSVTIWMIIIGFTMNLFTLAFIIALARSKKLSGFLIKIFKSLGKIKFLTKIIEKNLPKFENYCNNFQCAYKEIMHDTWQFIFAIIVKTFSLLFYYAIPYFALKALGVELIFSDIIFIILASSFAITTMVWVPTPGGTGGIEFAFLMIFTTFSGVTADIGNAGMVVWRFLTYYLLLVLSGILYAIFEIIISKKNKNQSITVVEDKIND